MTETMTPSMQQYLSIKTEHEDCLLFYRLGDFYELFFEDAIVASKTLNIVLTKRGKNNGQDIPMCGVPYHSASHYIAKLVDNGFKIAICEQMESPEQAKKSRGYKAIVKREVVKIITAGTLIEEQLLNDETNNHILSFASNKNEKAIAWADVSTNKFYFTTISDKSLFDYISKINPKEIIYANNTINEEIIHKIANNTLLNEYPSIFFCPKKTENKIKNYYQIQSIESINHLTQAVIQAIGSLLEYIDITQKLTQVKLKYPQLYNSQLFMYLDHNTIHSLDLISSKSGNKKSTLFHTLNQTITPMATRLLQQYILTPLIDIDAIKNRQAMIEFFLSNYKLTKEIRLILSNIKDSERALTRITSNNYISKDLYTIKETLENTLNLSEILLPFSNIKQIKTLYNNLGLFSELYQDLNKALLPQTINKTKELDIINPEYNIALKQLLEQKDQVENNINKLLIDYRKTTGITSLKIKNNNILGYYIEIPAQHTNKMLDFIHKQTLSNVTRFSSTELQNLEYQIFSTNSNIEQLQKQILESLQKQISDNHENISLAIEAITKLDIYTSLSHLAKERNFIKPTIEDSMKFQLTEATHPVVSQNNSQFISNDISLSSEEYLMLITGPNMAGKSTYLRQNALIAIMAQIGSYIPAKKATIGIVDRIFTRIGADDNIMSGQSTFMVEMNETANIVRNATEKSLIIMDEVGRGTALFDGLSIASAVINYIHNKTKSRAIFATHYHELIDISQNLEHLKSYSMQIKEWNNKVIFLYKITPESIRKSYGINVARMAGLPTEIIEEATEILEKIQNKSNINLDYLLNK